MKIDLSLLEEYIKNGLIRKQKHPDFNLWIYNYTKECQYEGKWDEITKMCRGLVLDSEGNIIARPFEKFFNHNEIERIPDDNNYRIYEKLDGALIIAFSYRGKLVVASRGSFTSDFALLAHRLISNNLQLLQTIITSEKITWLFELTGPSSKIIVKYKKDELTLIGIIDTPTGDEFELDNFHKYNFIKVVNEWKGKEKSIEELRNLNLKNKEGFVLKWKNGFKLKIKFPEYIKLHRIIMSYNEKTIWEWLRSEKNIEDLKRQVPEEFHEWVDNVAGELNKKFEEIYDHCQNWIINSDILSFTRKDAAAKINKELKKYRGILFNMYDNREVEVEKIIWKLIKPKVKNVSIPNEQIS